MDENPYDFISSDAELTEEIFIASAPIEEVEKSST